LNVVQRAARFLFACAAMGPQRIEDGVWLPAPGHRLAGVGSRNVSPCGASSQVRAPRIRHERKETMKHLLLPPTSIDTAIATSAARHTNPIIQNCTRSMTWAADARVLGTLAAVGWIMSRGGGRRQRLVANHVAVSLTAAVMLPKVMKRAIDRTRPDRVVVGQRRRGVRTSGQPHDSFPSGHSVHIGAIVSALSWAYPKKARVFLAVGGALAATRVAVLAHWTTDVLLGLALGAATERAARRVSGGRKLRS
jgi:hypothetical protein